MKIVMRRLGGSMNNDGRLHFGDKGQNRVSIANINAVMGITGDRCSEPVQDPTGIAGLSEKYGSLVIIEPYNTETPTVKVDAHFRSD